MHGIREFRHNSPHTHTHTCVHTHTHTFHLRSENIQFIMKEVEKAAEKAASQMESICKDYNWLSDVWKFIRTREDSKQDYYMPADEFEVRIIKKKCV